jgi:hypothetical protein
MARVGHKEDMVRRRSLSLGGGQAENPADEL